MLTGSESGSFKTCGHSPGPTVIDGGPVGHMTKLPFPLGLPYTIHIIPSYI